MRADYFYWKVCPQDKSKNKDNSKLVYKNILSLVPNYLEAGYSVIVEGLLNRIDDYGMEERIREISSGSKVVYKRIYLRVDFENSRKRNNKKDFEMTDELLKEWIEEGESTITTNDDVVDTSDKILSQVIEEILSKLK